MVVMKIDHDDGTGWAPVELKGMISDGLKSI